MWLRAATLAFGNRISKRRALAFDSGVMLPATCTKHRLVPSGFRWKPGKLTTTAGVRLRRWCDRRLGATPGGVEVESWAWAVAAIG